MREVALGHLDRFATTRRRLGDLLKRRALRSAVAHGDDPAPLLAAIETTIQWLEAKGLLSDSDYAQASSRAMVGRGQSKRRIAAKLMAKGIDADTARGAIATLGEEFGDTDLVAARAYAKRRRLGRHRKDGSPSGRPSQRDLAAMARAGFSLETARKALSEEE
jgi:regulatory protein